MTTDEFDKWIEKHKIVERTKACFLFCMENYVEEEPDKFKAIYKTLDINSLETKQSTIKLCNTQEINQDMQYISSMLEVRFNGEVLGYYACVFGLDGALKMVV